MSTPTRRRFVLTGLAALTLSAAPLSTARAAEVTVTASLGNDRVQVGDGVYLRVEIETTGGVIGEPRFPKLEDVDVQSRGSSSGTSVSIINGRADRRSTKTYTYVLAPRKAGSFAIPVEVEVDGKVHRPAMTPKLIATGEAPAAAVDSGEAVSESPQSADSEVIVWPVVDKSTVYVGEQLIYELQLWRRSRSRFPSMKTAPTFKDFWSIALNDSSPERRRMVDGVPYLVEPGLSRALFPQKAGTLTIGAPTIEMRPRFRFDIQRRPPPTYQGRSLAIEVLPLPAEGQPPGFRANNVGQLELSAEVDREAIVQGEAVRLTVTISGAGNIPLIEPAAWPEVPGMRSYEPKAEEPVLTTKGTQIMGSREYTMLLVAEQAGRVEIPAIELPYFDPEAEAYAVARSEPITLEVAANPDAKPAEDGDEQGGGEGEGEGGDEDRELLAEPVAGDSLVRVTPRERWLTPKRWWAGTLAPPALLGLSWLAVRLARRFGPDDAARQRGQARQRRRILLAEASEALESGENFYPKLASLLHSAAIHRAGEDGVGLAREPLMKLLRERGAEAEEVQILRELLDACDMARFGAGSGDAATRAEHLERARELLGRSDWRIR